MPQYIIAYHGGSQPATREAGMAQMKAWQEWVGGMGDAVINPGTPLGQSKMLGGSGETIAPMSGFMIIEAADMDAATVMAEADPFLANGGTIELAEMMVMPGG
ncbi:MAG: hypothetical protein JKX69_02855 [Rhodobacteraceae bacterium]|nr:hypothetical protein [Paracoccaceae bacterium]